MLESTDINSLPVNNSFNDERNTVVNQIPQQQMSQQQMPQQMPTQNNQNNTINQLITGIQSASQAGATDLPNRDIPMNTVQITTDDTIKPNHIPEAPARDYIQNDTEINEINNYMMQNQNKKVTADNLFNEFYDIIIIFVLFFLFQLPFVNKNLKKIFPFTFKIDGNISIYGYLIKTLSFSSVYYLVNKAISYFSTM